jgi:hypothetical protein
LFSKRELSEFRSLTAKEQTEWLFSRSSAKDAVRAYALRVHARKIFPSDVEITLDREAITVGGAWAAEIGRLPQVSCCYGRGWSVAVAGSRSSSVAAMEMDEAVRPNYFLPDEEERLARLRDPEEWKRRALLAKQAAGKYFNPGAGEVFWQTLVISSLDESRGWFGVADPSSAVNREDLLQVVTMREGNFLVAVAFQS